MGSQSGSFEAVVIGAVGIVMGVAYLLGAMLAMLGNGGNGVLVLGDSVLVTTAIGILLLLTAGFLGTAHRQGRYVGVLAFGAVAVFGRPGFDGSEPFLIAQAGFALLITVYLLFRNPVPAPERSPVDESTSATRVGSTIR